MAHVTKSKKRCPRIKGIVADARALGVSRCHLSGVLHGTRAGKKLLKRYRDMKQQQEEAAPKTNAPELHRELQQIDRALGSINQNPKK